MTAVSSSTWYSDEREVVCRPLPAPVADSADNSPVEAAQRIDQRRLADAAGPGEDDGLAGDHASHAVKPRSGPGGNTDNGQREFAVDRHVRTRGGKVGLVERHSDIETATLGQNHGAVDEACIEDRPGNGGDNHRQIDICGKNMFPASLATEPASVAPRSREHRATRKNVRHERRIVRLAGRCESDAVADHRIGIHRGHRRAADRRAVDLDGNAYTVNLDDEMAAHRPRARRTARREANRTAMRPGIAGQADGPFTTLQLSSFILSAACT